MTESEWLSCQEPHQMLAFLREGGRASERKLRLFAVGCCRRLAHLLPDPRSRTALDTCERYAEGRAGVGELRSAREAAVASYDRYSDHDEFGRFTGTESAAAAVAGACWPGAEGREAGLFEVVDNAIGLGRLTTGWRNGGRIERARQCRSLRDVFGNPFRPPPRVAPCVLTWNNGTVVKLASAVYEERAFSHGRMGVLADAAEEAGCTDQEVLSHLRGPGGRHVRGCIALDLVLGKG